MIRKIVVYRSKWFWESGKNRIVNTSDGHTTNRICLLNLVKSTEVNSLLMTFYTSFRDCNIVLWGLGKKYLSLEPANYHFHLINHHPVSTLILPLRGYQRMVSPCGKFTCTASSWPAWTSKPWESWQQSIVNFKHSAEGNVHFVL